MKDYKVVIDAGHGGDDPGSSGNGIIEKDLTLDISNYMYDRFKSLGIPVKMTRTTDETLSPTERVNRVLNAFGNDSDVIVLSNHINAGGAEGAEVIYALRSTATLPNLILESLQEAGQTSRKAYQRRLPSNPSKDYYFMNRDTGNTLSLIVEYGFLDNAKDAAKLKNNWQAYTDAVVDAVLEYMGIGSSDKNYTVQKGDSLWSVAKKFNVSVEELKSVNNLSSNLLKIGQILKIPQEEIETKPSNEYSIYTVQKGDSLYSIANRYNTTVDKLINYNNLSSTNLSIGQQLLIPVEDKTEDTTTYTVKSGDTLYKIAERYNTTVTDIMALNNLKTSILSIGQVLKIPQKSTTLPSTSNYIEYVVKRGDNLYSIANKYGTTVSEIKNLNNLSTNNLSIGQTLKIPSDGQTTYVVKSGDNLYSIAAKYNTSVNAIKQKNNLTSNNLSIGQILII